MSRYVDLSNPKIFYNGRDKFGNGIYHIPPDLPTDDVVKRKKGKWIEADDSDNRIRGRCSVCGWESHLYEDDVVGMDFCPNCGADMRGDEQDE